MKPVLLQGEPLYELARKLGVSEHESGLNEAIIQARVLAALRERRDGKLWLVALISAIASALSALAAWHAVAFGR